MPERDDELIAELRDLGRRLAIPEAADQRAAVRARLAAQPVRRRRPLLRILVASVVAAVAATVLGVAPARAAVFDAVADVLRVAGIEVRRTAAPPPAPAPSPLPSTGVVTLEQARREVPFGLKVPADLGPPEQVLLADPDPAGTPRVVSMTFRGGTVRFDQFDGSAGVFLKQAPEAQWVEIGGIPGVWLSEPHTLTYVDRSGAERPATARLATPTLIWETNGVTYRLEGFTDLGQARAVALSVS